MVVEKSLSDQVLPDLEQTKYEHPIPNLLRFLIPEDFQFHQLQQVIRNRLQLPKTHALYIFFKNNKLYTNGKWSPLVINMNGREEDQADQAGVRRRGWLPILQI